MKTIASTSCTSASAAAARLRGVACALVVCACVALPSGCTRTRCDEIADEVREKLEACGVDFGQLGHGVPRACTDYLIEHEECLLACYDSASCEQYTWQDREGAEALEACFSAC